MFIKTTATIRSMARKPGNPGPSIRDFHLGDFERTAIRLYDKAMIISPLAAATTAELRYAIPLDLLDISTQRDTTAIHVIEHWWLEGAGQYAGSKEPFRAARDLGGSLSAHTSRKAVEIRLCYHAPWIKEALALLSQIVQQPKFSPDTLKDQMDDVTIELENDDPLTKLFGSLYRDSFADRYGFYSGGVLEHLKKLDPDRLLGLAAKMHQTPGRLFWAGPAGFEPASHALDELKPDFKFKPVLLKNFTRRHYTDETFGIGLLAIDFAGNRLDGEALGWYLHIMFGNYAALHQHFLPNFILRTVSYDIGDVLPEDIQRAVQHYKANHHYHELAQAEIDNQKSQPSTANDLARDDWVFGAFLPQG